MPPPSSYERRWLILALIATAQLMIVLDLTIVNIALPSAQQDLGFSNDDRQWIITSYALAFGSLLLLGGKLGDLFGRKWAFTGGLVGFAVASAVGGAAESFGDSSARARLRCLRRAARSVSARAARHHVQRPRRTRQGVRHLRRSRRRRLSRRPAPRRNPHRVAQLALVPVRESADRRAHGDRRAAADRNVAPSSREPLDLVGTTLATAGLFALVYGFSNSESHSWGHPVTIIALALAVVLLSAFVIVESRVEHPLLPLRVIADRVRGGSFLALGISGIALFAVFLFLTYYLQLTKGFSPIETGLAYLPMTAAIVISATLATNNFLAKTGPCPLLVLGMTLGALAMVWFAQLDTTSSYAGRVLPGLIVLGIGMGLIFATGSPQRPTASPPRTQASPPRW